MGTLVDGAVDDVDGNKDDALLASSGSRKQSPYLVHRRCRRKPRPPMGPGRPLAGSAGGSRVALDFDAGHIGASSLSQADPCAELLGRFHMDFEAPKEKGGLGW